MKRIFVLSDCHDLFQRGFEFLFGSQARAGIIQIALFSPFLFMSWLYQRILKLEYFRPDSVVLYAAMIERIEFDEWFIASMKSKGWTESQEAAYRQRDWY